MKLLSKSILWLVLVLTCTIQSHLVAQINVNVVVAPPYPIHLDDYLGRGDQMILTITNVSAVTQSIKLLGSIEGVTTGLKAEVSPSFQPQAPLVLTAMETKVLSFNQLRQYNGNLTMDDILTKNIDVNQIIRTETLPEGYYNVCIRALDYNTGALLTKACTNINLTWYDPPIIVNPAHQATIVPLNPQFQAINWTPAGQSGLTRYRLDVVDMTQNGLFNPNEAFQTPGIVPLFTIENLTAPAFIYGMQHPPLIPCHVYALRVTAYDITNKIVFKNQGQSPVTTFTYQCGLVVNPPVFGGGNDNNNGNGNGGIVIDDLPINGGGGGAQFMEPAYDPDDVLDCFSANAGTIPMPNETGKHAAKIGEIVTIGKFKMKILTINAGIGTGTILLNFLNTNVKVKFEQLEINAQNQACGTAKAWVDLDKNGLIDLALLNDPSGTIGQGVLQSTQIRDFINANNRKVSKFTGPNSPAIGVPFALDNANGLNLNILGIIFTTTKAYVNTAFDTPIPESISGEWLTLATKGVIIRPNGFGVTELKIALAQDQTFDLSNKSKIRFLKGNNQTYITVGCKGIIEAHLAGGLILDRSLAIPADKDGKIINGNTQLEAKFNVLLTKAAGWIADEITPSHPMFVVPKAEDVLFKINDLVLDFHKSENSVNMKFHPNHPKKGQKDWVGLYLKELTVVFPDWLKKGNQRVTVNSKDMLLDKTGFWAQTMITPIFPNADDGDLGGWPCSVDSLKLDIRASALSGGGIAGKIRLPISGTDLKYSATISQGTNAAKWSFSITTKSEIEVEMFVAKVTLAPNSTIKIEKDDNQKISPSAVLNGKISVGWEKGADLNKKNGIDDDENAVSSFQLPTLQFIELHITTNKQNIPQLNNFQIELDNPNEKQGLLAGFPLQLSAPSIKKSGNFVTLGLPVSLSLTKGTLGKNGLSGGTNLVIFGAYDAIKRRFVYKKTSIDSIGFDMDIAVAHIKGGVRIYKNDLTFGDGFKGNIEASIKGLVKVGVTLQVGNMPANKDKPAYDYFYFDGLAQISAGLPIPGTAAAIYGFGGGFYYNMSRNEPPKDGMDYQAFVNKGGETPVGKSQSGLVYTPQSGGLGFSATVIFGLSGGEQAAAAFNGDLTFRMAFTGKAGIKNIVIEGNVMVAQSLGSLASKAKAGIAGHGKIVVDFEANSFDLQTSLTVKVGKVLEGGGKIKMFFSPNDWHIYFGKWSISGSDEPWADQERIYIKAGFDGGVVKVAAQFSAYFMMGSKMPPLPPLPKLVRDMMKDYEGNSVADERDAFSPLNTNNPGFGFGVGIHVGIDFKVLIFYADLDLKLGFDALLSKYDLTECSEKFGIDGWFAQGQAYAHIEGGAGIDLSKVWIWKAKFEIIHLDATAVLEAKLPNPIWMKGYVAFNVELLNGLIKVNTEFGFETGRKPQCLPAHNPFSDYPIIADISPKKDETIGVHKAIRLAFNFPKDVFVVFDENQEEPKKRYFKYKIEVFKVTKNGQPLAFNPIEYSVDGYSARYRFKGATGFLPDKSTLKMEITANGYEIIGNTEKLMTTPAEKYSHEFKTGAKPKKVLISALAESRPQPSQRYFLPGNPDFGQKGFIRWKNGYDQSDLFTKQAVDPTEAAIYDLSKTKFFVRFTELTTGKRTEVPMVVTTGEVTFDIPATLKKTSIYSAEIIKQMTTKPEEIVGGVGGGGGGVDGQGNIIQQEDWAYTGEEWQYVQAGTFRLSRYLRPDLPTQKIDFVLYKIHFKTSKYTTLEEKLATYKVKSTGIVPEYGKFKYITEGNNPNVMYSGLDMHAYSLPVVFISGGEPFDVYDCYGYDLEKEYDETVSPNVIFQEAADISKHPADLYRKIAKIHDDFGIQAKDRYNPSDMRWADISALSPRLSHPNTIVAGTQIPWPGYWEVWRGSKWGNAQAYAPNGTKVSMPAQVLSKHEIEAAAAQAPQQQQQNGLNNFVINTQPNPIQPLNLNLGIDPATMCLPMIDVSAALTFNDYSKYLSHMQPRVADYGTDKLLKWVKATQTEIQPSRRPKPGETYKMNWGGKVFTYKFPN